MFSHVSFASIPVTDPDRALVFWRDKMGLDLHVDAQMGALRWIMLEMPGAPTRLHLDHVREMPETAKPALPLIAPDVRGSVDLLRGRGVEILADPKPAEWDPGTTYALVRDSEGNVILIASR